MPFKMEITFDFDCRSDCVCSLSSPQPPFNLGTWTWTHDAASRLTTVTCADVPLSVAAHSVVLMTEHQWAKNTEVRVERVIGGGRFPPTKAWSLSCPLGNSSGNWSWRATLKFTRVNGSLLATENIQSQASQVSQPANNALAARVSCESSASPRGGL
jgi:hypothetical protein